MTTEQTAAPLLRLRIHYKGLRASEQRVADYILSHQEEIVFLSISALANLCDTSETSVIRLCKALGYNGYQHFKMDLARSNRPDSPDTHYNHIHEDVSDRDDIAAIIQKVMNTNIQAIEETKFTLDPGQTQAAVAAISNTHRLEFYGMGGSGCVAIDAHHKFFKFGFSCNAYVDPHMQAMSAATMKPGDVVVGISNSGNTKELINSLNIAKEAGATTICITGNADSNIAKICDIVLIATANERRYKPEPMSIRIAQLSIIDILAVAVTIPRQEDVLHILQKTRRAVGKSKRKS